MASGSIDKAVDRFARECWEMPDAERDAWISENCDDNSSLREMVHNKIIEVKLRNTATQLDKTVEEILNPTASGNDDSKAAASDAGGMGESVFDWQPGQHISKYTLIEILGKGGMGVVWKARGPRGLFYALKVIKGSPKDDLIQRMNREANLQRKVEHKHVCKLAESECLIDSEGCPVIVMEYVPGFSLKQHISTRRRNAIDVFPVNLDRCKHIVSKFIPVLEGLLACHAKQLVHRDFHPGNLVGMPLKIVDFGLAYDELRRHLQVTESGRALGHPDYCSPELWRGEKTTRATDVFSAAVMLYEWIAGRLPWVKGSEENPSGIRRREPLAQAIAPHDPHIQMLSDILDACMNHVPENRPTVMGLIDQLTKWKEGKLDKVEVLVLRDLYKHEAHRRKSSRIIRAMSAIAIVLFACTGVSLHRWARDAGELNAIKSKLTTVEREQLQLVEGIAGLVLSQGADIGTVQRQLEVVEKVASNTDLPIEKRQELWSELAATAYDRQLFEIAERGFSWLYQSYGGDGATDSTELALAALGVGRSRVGQRRLDDAEPFLKRAVEIQERLLNRPASERATCYLAVAHLLHLQGKLKASLAQTEMALEECAKDPDSPGIDLHLARHMKSLILFDLGDLTAAVELLEQAVSGLTIARGLDDSETLVVRYTLARVNGEGGGESDPDKAHQRRVEAVKECIQLEPQFHRVFGSISHNMVQLLITRGHAERLLKFTEDWHKSSKRALSIAKQLPPAEHPQEAIMGALTAIAIPSISLGNQLRVQGKVVEAGVEYRSAKDALTEAVGVARGIDSKGQAYAESLSNLGVVLFRLGEFDKAEERLRLALPLRREMFGNSAPLTLGTQRVLGQVLVAGWNDKPERAKEGVDLLRPIASRLFDGDESVEVQWTVAWMVHGLRRAGLTTDAEEWEGRIREKSWKAITIEDEYVVK